MWSGVHGCSKSAFTTSYPIQESVRLFCGRRCYAVVLFCAGRCSGRTDCMHSSTPCFAGQTHEYKT